MTVEPTGEYGRVIEFPPMQQPAEAHDDHTTPDAGLYEPETDEATTTSVAPRPQAQPPARRTQGRELAARSGQLAVRGLKVTPHVTKAALTSAPVQVTKRHAVITWKGMDAARQQRKAERTQGDLKTARAIALQAQDYQAAREINRDMQTRHVSKAEALKVQVEAWWSLIVKASVAVVVMLGVCVVTGLINWASGYPLGLWTGLDVLLLLGRTVAAMFRFGSFVFTHWLAIAALGMTAVTVVWLSRRWRDGRALGEMVLPVDLRRGDAAQNVVMDENTLVKALANLGYADLKKVIAAGWPNRDGDRAWVQFPILDGPGMATSIRLPEGFPLEKAQKAKTTLAHNLGCLPAELRITRNTADPTVMDLFRLNPGELRKPTPQYPMLHDGGADFFHGVPVGITPFGKEITGHLFERNYVIAGIMGSGKTTLILALLAGCALDPLVDIDVLCFAENADYDQLVPLLNTHIQGDGPEIVDQAHEHMADLMADLGRRGQLLKKHGVRKVNREVAAKEPGLRPRVVVLDECQKFFRQDDPKDRKAVVNSVYNLIAAARKYGVVIVLATPSPSDDSLPRDIVAVTTNNACGAINDKRRNNVVLGENAYENGISALGLVPRDPETKELNDTGTLITKGFTSADSETLRTYYVNETDMATVVERALELRGGPVQRTEAPEPEQRDLLGDVAEVLGDESSVKATDVVSRLRELAPNHRPYASLNADKLKAELAEYGVKVTKAGVLTVYAARVQAALLDRADEEGEGAED